MKRVFSSWNLAAVHHARNVLDAAGIRAVVKNEYLASAMGDLPPAECQAELWILREADYAMAEEILFRSQPQGEAWKCRCGEELAAQFSQCWNCGSYRA